MHPGRAVVAAVALLLTACGTSVRLHKGQGTGTTIGQADPGSLRPATGASSHGDVTTRRVCRTGGYPSGWIAVAYSEATSECPRLVGGGNAYSVAVIVRYDNLPYSTTLEVCADQPTPSGWYNETADERSSDGCPGAAKNGGSATKVIRRAS